MPVGDVTLKFIKSDEYSYTGITPLHDTAEFYIEATNQSGRPSYTIELLTTAYDSAGVAQASDTPRSTFLTSDNTRIVRPKLRGLLVGQLYRVTAFAVDYSTKDILSTKLLLVGVFDQVKTMWSTGVEANIPPPTQEPGPIATIYTQVPGYEEPQAVEISPTGDITLAQEPPAAEQPPALGRRSGLLKGALAALAAYAIAKGARRR